MKISNRQHGFNTEDKQPTQIKVFKRSDPLELLKLPLKIESALKSRDIVSIGKLCKCKRKKLYKIKNLGRKSVNFLMKVKRSIQLEEPVVELFSQNNGLLPQPIQIQLKPEVNKSTWIPSDINSQVPLFLSRKDSVEALGLPTRLENALIWANITTIGDFYDCTEKSLIHRRNLGPKSIKYLMTVRERIKLPSKQANVRETEAEIHKSVSEISIPEIPNELLIESLMQHCDNPRVVEVIKRRYGLINGEKETLEDIGKSFHVTRERVRQLQEKALKKMKRPMVLEKDPIMQLVEKIIHENNGIISDEEADKLIPQIFKNLPYDGSSLLDLFSDLKWIDNHRVGDVTFYSILSNKLKLSILIEDVVKILKKNEGLLRAEQILEKLGYSGNDAIRLQIHRICKLDPRIEESITDGFTSSTYGKRSIWISLILQVLEDEETPLHFTEIADRVNDLLLSHDKHLDHRRAHSILVQTPKFANTGVRGMYGLTEWGLRKDSSTDLSEECIRNAGFPMHWEQIFHYVSKYKYSSKASVRNILDNSGRFENKGNGLYSLKNID